MYLPSAGVEVSAWVLTALGFIAGVLAGFFGIGGGFLVTPALNILGMPVAYAIGTDLAHIMGNSVVATLRHRKLGNVDLRLGVLMIAGTAAGVEAGKLTVLTLEEAGIAGDAVRVLYILLLGGTSACMLRDYLKDGEEPGERLRELSSRLRLPPLLSLPASGIRQVSLWLVLGVGFATGFLAGLLGVGGGFIRMPAMIYALGVPTTVAVGTDLFEIIFSSAIGAMVYAKEGRVELLAAMLMLPGSALGAHVGALGTKYVRGLKIRLYFALTMLFAALSVALKQAASMYSYAPAEALAALLLFGSAGLMATNILLCTLRGAVQERAAPAERRGVLAASGGSVHALRALRVAARIAVRSGEKLTLLVVEEPGMPLKQVTERSLRAVLAEGASAEVKVRKGSPAGEILRESRRYGLLVIGSHGTKSIAEHLLGGNAERVVSRMRTSTLVVRGERISRVLVCLRLPEYRRGVVRSALELARIFGAELRFVSVLPQPVLYRVKTLPLSLEDVLHIYPGRRRAMQEVLEAAAREGVPATASFRQGIPEEEILREAEEWGADLLVLGDSGWGRLSELVGSLSEHIVKHAPVSVLVVHRSSESLFCQPAQVKAGGACDCHDRHHPRLHGVGDHQVSHLRHRASHVQGYHGNAVVGFELLHRP